MKRELSIKDELRDMQPGETGCMCRILPETA